MKRLVLTTDSSAAGALERARLGDLVIAIERRIVWGPLPSDAGLHAFFAPRMAQPRDFTGWTTRQPGVRKIEP